MRDDLTSTDETADPRDIEADFCNAKGIDEQDDDDVSAVFEHGQWWISVDPDTADTYGLSTTYSVVDTNKGLDFEAC